jgi:hypothetical protein
MGALWQVLEDFHEAFLLGPRKRAVPFDLHAQHSVRVESYKVEGAFAPRGAEDNIAALLEHAPRLPLC